MRTRCTDPISESIELEANRVALQVLNEWERYQSEPLTVTTQRFVDAASVLDDAILLEHTFKRADEWAMIRGFVPPEEAV